MKLTMRCPECNAIFDEGLVAEVGDEVMDSVDICEFNGMEYKCQTCGHEVTIGYVAPYDKKGSDIY